MSCPTRCAYQYPGFIDSFTMTGSENQAVSLNTCSQCSVLLVEHMVLSKAYHITSSDMVDTGMVMKRMLA